MRPTPSHRPCLGQYPAAYEKLRGKVGSPRMLGSTLVQLAYLASGQIDAMVCYHDNLWDLAAGILIATEAGAVACRYDGTTWQPGNPDLILAHPDLVSEIIAAIEV